MVTPAPASATNTNANATNTNATSIATPVSSTTFDLTTLLESELQTAKGNVATTDALAPKRVVGLYFSASWCAPCREFTPMLAQVYDDIKELDGREDALEVVYISYDRTLEEFDAYFADMPWLALPFAKRDLKRDVGKAFGVRGVPMLIFVDSDGHVITEDGRDLVEELAADAAALLQALHK